MFFMKIIFPKKVKKNSIYLEYQQGGSMKNKSFTTELKYVSTPVHSVSLNMLYTPIIGLESTILYSLLKDFSYLNRNSRTYDTFEALMSIMQVNSMDFEIAMKKLEAVGLIRTFERSDETKYIIVLNEPLSPEAFRKNSFLYKQVVAKIGEIAYEKVEFSTKEATLSKDDFKEVTTKYQDIFAFEAPQENQIKTTQEIPLMNLKSTEEAIMALNSLQFIKYLANENATPTQQGLIQRMMQLGLSNPSLNEIINYVFNANGKIVSAHIEKIALDLSSKDIKMHKDIKEELQAAEKSKKSSVFDFDGTTVVVNKQSEVMQDAPSWDEIFSSLGGEL